jgi:hypothetical protein
LHACSCGGRESDRGVDDDNPIHLMAVGVLTISQ